MIIRVRRQTESFLFFFRFRFDKKKKKTPKSNGKNKRKHPERAFKKIKSFGGLGWKELRIGAVGHVDHYTEE